MAADLAAHAPHDHHAPHVHHDHHHDHHPAPLSPARGREWALVLAARLIPHRIERGGSGASGTGAPPACPFRLFVPPAFAQAACEEIAHYMAENPSRPEHGEPPTLPVPPGDAWVLLWGLAGLVLFNALTLGFAIAPLPALPWYALGQGDSGLVLAGQWWRLATALTLHADGAHLLGNVAIGGVFLFALARELRPGPTWFVAVASGVLGNLGNTLAHGPGHYSIGASTAVFGVVGALAGLRALRGQGIGGRTVFLPVAAGLTLLAFLGAGNGDGLPGAEHLPGSLEDRTDLGAHLFGFLAGLGLGGAGGLLLNRFGLPGRFVRHLAGATALAAMVAGWWAATAALP